MVKSAFRPSDDATKLPFNIPQNALACTALRGVAAVLARLGPGAVEAAKLGVEAVKLAGEIDQGNIRRPRLNNSGVAGYIGWI